MIPSLKGVILFGAENASFFYQKETLYLEEIFIILIQDI